MITYDYIVVGGGTAGCVLAARLSERHVVTVLLLEAGPAQPPSAAASPPAWPSLMQTPANWGDHTVVQAATGTSAPLPRGRGLGGSTLINAMTFARGHRSSYDAWGVRGWGFDDLVPCFRRSETAVGRDPDLRGTSGPLTVGPANPRNPVFAACLDAAAETGLPIAGDVSGGLEEGFGWADLNIVGGARQSAADAYLTEEVRARPNLHVITGATVHKLTIHNGRCVGVEYTRDGVSGRSETTQEVVLAAGTIGSAQLLMLSGIGPGDHLTQTGIDVVCDLPGVGANLHDHPITNLVHSAAQPVPPGRNNHGEAFGLISTQYATDGPDLQILFVDAPGHIVGGLPVDQGYTIATSIMRPHSRGTVRLADAAPTTAPVLNPNYFGDERDMDTMIAGIGLARQIGRASALTPWRSTELAPGPHADSREYVRRTLASYCHPVGTCKMGVDSDTVVDPELRVHGLPGLRIADGSVIPSIPSANTSATVYAIAERAAELLAS